MSVTLPKPIRVFVTGAGGRTGEPQWCSMLRRQYSKRHVDKVIVHDDEQPLLYVGRLVFNKLKSRPEHFAVKGLVRLEIASEALIHSSSTTSNGTCMHVSAAI